MLPNDNSESIWYKKIHYYNCNKQIVEIMRIRLIVEKKSVRFLGLQLGVFGTYDSTLLYHQIHHVVTVNHCTAATMSWRDSTALLPPCRNKRNLDVPNRLFTLATSRTNNNNLTTNIDMSPLLLQLSCQRIPLHRWSAIIPALLSGGRTQLILRALTTIARRWIVRQERLRAQHLLAHVTLDRRMRLQLETVVEPRRHHRVDEVVHHVSAVVRGWGDA